MLIRINKLLWDATGVNQDITQLTDYIHKNGIIAAIRPTIRVTPVGDYYLVVTGRRFARALVAMGEYEIDCIVVNMTELEIITMRAV